MDPSRSRGISTDLQNLLCQNLNVWQSKFEFSCRLNKNSLLSSNREIKFYEKFFYFEFLKKNLYFKIKISSQDTFFKIFFTVTKTGLF